LSFDRTVVALTRRNRRPQAVVLRALGLGDLMTAIPALRALRRALPHHEITLLTPARFESVVMHAGLADRVLAVEALGPPPPTLASPNVDLAVNLHGRGPESHHMLRALRPRRMIAFDHAQVPSTPRIPWRADEHEVQRWCRLMTASGIPADPDDLAVVTPKSAVAAAGAGATVVHPGAAAAARRWPPARWADVARAEHAVGRRVLITGGPGEEPLAHGVARLAGLPPSHVLAGSIDTLDLLAVVGAAARVVCGDTGIAHVATAVGTPSVILFGPTDPRWWGPPSCTRHHVLWSGRTGDPHDTRPAPGLLDIAVDDVVEALSTLPGVPGQA
jgi:ADP-heptose:LPS heptosyltransferase